MKATTVAKAATSLALALGLGTAQAYPLETRVQGCSSIMGHIGAIHEFRVAEAPIELAYAVLVYDPALHPVERFVVKYMVDSTYAMTLAEVPPLDVYRVATYSLCIVKLGTGQLELPAELRGGGVTPPKSERREG